MVRFGEMPGGVAVPGRVTTSDVRAREAHAERDPRVTGFHTIVTDVSIRVSDPNLIEMLAFFCHGSSAPVWFV